MSILGASKAWINFFGHGSIKDAYYKQEKKKKKNFNGPHNWRLPHTIPGHIW